MSIRSTRHPHAGLFAGLAAGALVLIGATAAYAGCNPACTGNQVCRYEAAGGKFYCAAPVAGGKVAPGRAPGGRTPAEGAAPSGAAGRPATTAPATPR